jgi:hypothetical protein
LQVGGRARTLIVVRRTAVLLLAVALVPVPGAVAASANDGDDVRVTGKCTGGARSTMRLRARDEGIEVRFEVDHARAGLWSATVVHERRVAWKGRYRVRSGGGSFELRRTIADLAGADAFTVRALGPRGGTCRADGTLAESDR